MTNFFYSLIVALATPFVVLLFCFHPRGRFKISERLGVWRDKPSGRVLWFHGASLGEVKALKKLVEGIRKDFPDYKFILSCTSTSVFEAKVDFFDRIYFLPFDSKFLIRKATARLNISLFVYTETEWWPNLSYVLSQRKIPVLNINARISDKTFPRYLLTKPFFKGVFSSTNFFCCATTESLNRLKRLGVSEGRLEVTGNTKYDYEVELSEDSKNKMRSFFADSAKPIITLGSVRPKELEFWLDAIGRSGKDAENFNFIIAPRHKDQFINSAKIIEGMGLAFSCWEDINDLDSSNDESNILLLNTYGELINAYSISLASFIGATLINLGGHNPIEAIRAGSYVVIGNHYQNVKEEVAELLKLNAVSIIYDPKKIDELIVELNKNIVQFKEKSLEGMNYFNSNQNSVAKVVQVIEKYIK